MGNTFLRLLRNWRLVTFRKFLYIPHILDQQERYLLLFLLFMLLLSGGVIVTKVYLKITKMIPAVGGSYSEGMLREPRIINPLFALQDADRDFAYLVFSRLLTYSGNGEVQYDLAQDLKISADGKTYTVFLKEGATFHDGEPVSADDVVFTVKTIQNPQYKSVLRANWQGVSVEKLDSHTVRFTLRSPYAPFIENLATGILPKHLWEKIGPEEALLHELNLKPIGSGPYKFDRFKQAKDGSIIWYRLARNPHYYREGPYLKKITFNFFKTEEGLTRAVRKEVINGFGPVSSSQLKEIEFTKKSLFTIAMPRIFGIFFNERGSEALIDKKVRAAIALAINKEEIIKNTAYSGAVPSNTPLPFFNLGESSENQHSYDPGLARKLLEEAGWKDEDSDSIREKKGRKKGERTVIPLHLKLTTSDWPELVRATEHIRLMLRNVGVDIALEKRSFADLESAVIRPRNFEMLLFGQVYGYEPDPFAFWHSSQIKDPGLNIALYSNKKVDQILEEARRISDPEERKKRYEEFARLVAEDLPAVFLYSQVYLYLLPSDLKGVNLTKISLPSDRFNEVNKWHRETKRVLK